MSKATKRKHVTKEIQEDLRVPGDDETIVQIVGSRGNNLHEVVDCTGEKFLVSMPVKFRRNIWVKSGSFVLVEPILEGDKVKAEITNILTKEHIKFYRSENIWPKEFNEDKQLNKNHEIQQRQDENSSSDNELFVNTNRQFVNNVNQSSSSDSSDSD